MTCLVAVWPPLCPAEQVAEGDEAVLAGKQARALPTLLEVLEDRNQLLAVAATLRPRLKVLQIRQWCIASLGSRTIMTDTIISAKIPTQYILQGAWLQRYDTHAPIHHNHNMYLGGMAALSSRMVASSSSGMSSKWSSTKRFRNARDRTFRPP